MKNEFIKLKTKKGENFLLNVADIKYIFPSYKKNVCNLYIDWKMDNFIEIDKPFSFFEKILTKQKK